MQRETKPSRWLIAHDKKVAENERISYPREATLYKDTGFQGYEPRVHKTVGRGTHREMERKRFIKWDLHS